MAALDVDDLTFMLQDLQRRFWGLEAEGNRISLRDLVIKRRGHFHNLNTPEIAPVLTGALKGMPVFQTDLPRRKHKELKSRLTENHFIIRVEPTTEGSTERAPANEVEAGFNAMLRLVEERAGYQFQDAIADGQIIDGAAVLHWRMLEDIIPDPDDREWIENLPEDKEAKKNYRRAKGGGKKKYRETLKSWRDRRNATMVKAGAPWHAEVIPITDCLWDFDTMGLSVFATIRTIPVWTYNLQNKNTGRGLTVLDEVDGNKELRIFRSTAEAPTELTGKPTFDDRVVVAQVWTRDHFYELISNNVFQEATSFLAGWSIMDSGPHPYSGPPFSIIPAIIANTESPELKYEPMLEGVFRLKPIYDRAVSLMLGLLEQDSNPYYYLRRVANGEPMLDNKGDPLYMTQDSELAVKVPDGYELVKLDFKLGEGEVTGVQFLKEEINEAAPATGRAQYSASTQPWTMRLSLQQESVEPKRLIQLQQLGLQAMARDMLHVHSLSSEDGGFAEDAVIYAKSTDGKLEKDTIVSIPRESVRTLQAEVDIMSTSQAERITLVEHGRALLADPLVPLSTIAFLEDYMGESDPDKVYADWKARTAYEQIVEPPLIQQELARWMGSRIVLGENGEFVGPGGAPVSPEQVLQQNGQTPLPLQDQGVSQGPPAAQQGNAIQTRMPGLPGMNVEGTMPMQGLVG